MTHASKVSDLVAIPGDYQKKALESGHPFQRAWHWCRVSALVESFDISKNDIIADIGCGSGLAIEALAPHAGRVFGVDSNPAAIEWCSKFFESRSNVAIRQGFLHDTGLAEASLDKIVCAEVIEHVYDKDIPEILQHWMRILRPNGLLFVTTPNSLSFWPLLEWTLDVLKLAPKMKGDQHVSHWTPRKLRKTLEQAGYADVRTGSFNLLAPFLGMVSSRNIAKAIVRQELRWVHHGGALVWAIARKPR